MSIEISFEQSGTVTIAVPRGRLDTLGAPKFGTAVTERIADGTRNLIVDLAGVVFVSSMGIRSLLIAAEELGRHGGNFAVCHTSDAVAGVLDVAGVGKMIALCPTRVEALATVC